MTEISIRDGAELAFCRDDDVSGRQYRRRWMPRREVYVHLRTYRRQQLALPGVVDGRIIFYIYVASLFIPKQ